MPVFNQRNNFVSKKKYNQEGLIKNFKTIYSEQAHTQVNLQFRTPIHHKACLGLHRKAVFCL